MDGNRDGSGGQPLMNALEWKQTLTGRSPLSASRGVQSMKAPAANNRSTSATVPERAALKNCLLSCSSGGVLPIQSIIHIAGRLKPFMCQVRTNQASSISLAACFPSPGCILGCRMRFVNETGTLLFSSSPAEQPEPRLSQRYPSGLVHRQHRHDTTVHQPQVC